MENTIAKQFRLSQRGGQNGRSPSALSYAQFGSCADAIEVNMEYVRMKAWDLQKNIDKVKGSYEQACEHSSDLQQDNSRESCRISVKGVNMEIENLLWTAGASVHMMSKVPPEDQKNSPSSRPPTSRQSQRRSDSTRQRFGCPWSQ